MKWYMTLGIIILVIAILLVGLKLYSNKTNSEIEHYNYTVLKSDNEIEIREYEASLFTAVTLKDNGYKDNSSRGFRVLAGYIFGGNDEQEKIAMTSPVSMSLGESPEMMFMVPSKYSKSDLPKPNDDSIEFKEVDVKKMAAIRFGGWANDEKIEKYKVKLTNYLDQKQIEYTGNFLLYGYNPPYEIFNRRNEVLVELVDQTEL